ncbi:hypothetical protein [Chromobacterium violaceum]|uniref:hypothetical protein n=1 Tax=Chromobacterium violaceum TaxID=536 RepID=UPI00111BE95B|nr:hypothetical protein [Chromobacterium violaceum]QIY79339.1 hypothetical protein FOB43_09120 [Chromobacterium violaceum]QRO31875.1 hypothetical protein I6K04_15380 [Chromobacterium violaceum]QRQ18325.1 hypothetical protein I6K03_07350 [Chromobacterium violaceum]
MNKFGWIYPQSTQPLRNAIIQCLSTGQTYEAKGFFVIVHIKRLPSAVSSFYSCANEKPLRRDKLHAKKVLHKQVGKTGSTTVDNHESAENVKVIHNCSPD